MSAVVVVSNEEGTEGIPVADQAIVGVTAAAPWAGGVRALYCAKYALSSGLPVTNFAFTVRTGFEKRMLPATKIVGEQNAM